MAISYLRRSPDLRGQTLQKPVKKIHDGSDVTWWLSSRAYIDLTTFILQLNHAVVPRKNSPEDTIQTWPLNDTTKTYSDPIQRLRLLLKKLNDLLKDAPPDTGPRRFGNVSFRTWFRLVEDKAKDLLREALPPDLEPALDEIEGYLLGSFGSPQRLDYGTGHELSFIAFLGCLWKLDFFAKDEPGVEERGIVLGVFEMYLELARELILTYTLEPAGSHGVWGLDDNSFVPYIFGSAQLSPAIKDTDNTPTEGSLSDAPEPGWVSKANLVEKEKDTNMYFAAVAFILEVKKGPFWEHSPMLFDISGIKDGWGKINKGMLKMYNAEVLSKFPVVQHFPFGSLFSWEKDPSAKAVPVTIHNASQPLRNPMASTSSTPRAVPQSVTSAPWAASGRPAPPPTGFVNGVTQAPWASRTPVPLRGNAREAFKKPAPAIPEKGPPS